jgi:hypothetical protein
MRPKQNEATLFALPVSLFQNYFPCSLIYRKTACKALLLWYDSEPIQPKTANINPKPTLFPLNSLLTAKIRGDWLARDCLHHQTITFAFLQILERKTASS